MATKVITPSLKEKLQEFLSKKRSADLLATYMFFLEEKFNVAPVVFPPGKMIYQSVEDAITRLEKAGKLWHEAQITISFDEDAVNAETKKIYICPFSGKVFGNNTHPNPQDAIYDWVSRCKENTERKGGLPSKRFYVSEDPEVIKNYIVERKKPITKTVYSSVITGKLFNSRNSVVKDFKQNYLKPMSMVEVQSQNRFDIEENFLSFIQSQLDEAKISAFVEEMSEVDELASFVERWMEE